MQTGKPDWWDDARDFLSKDSLLGPIVEKYDGCLEGKGNLFSTFVRSIVGQQISVIAADAVWSRLVDYVGDITPENFTGLSIEQLASCGLSRSKSDYIIGVARKSSDFLAPDFPSLSDDEINKHFVSFRGIGPWTSEMMMIFALLRPDIFSIGDIGLIKAVKILEPKAESKEDVLAVSERWAPFRTAASWYLWRMLDPVPVAY